MTRLSVSVSDCDRRALESAAVAAVPVQSTGRQDRGQSSGCRVAGDTGELRVQHNTTRWQHSHTRLTCGVLQEYEETVE